MVLIPRRAQKVNCFENFDYSSNIFFDNVLLLTKILGTLYSVITPVSYPSIYMFLNKPSIKSVNTDILKRNLYGFLVVRYSPSTRILP